MGLGLGLGLALAPAARRSFYDAEIARYRKEKAEVEAEARKLEAEARKFNEISDQALYPHQRLAQATTFVQIAISLTAITVLTRRRWLYWGSMIAASAGTVFWILAWVR